MATIFNCRRAFHKSIQNFRATRRPRKSNPGAAYQIEGLGSDDAFEADPEGFGDMESDFSRLHQTHREHEAQLQQQRERVRQFMVKHKYFRDQKLPNLLTFAEKEQIRLLHERDAKEWTIEQLAESFPATPQIIKKVLRAKWRPQSVERIRKHDAAVLHNWDQLNNGKLEIPISSELLNHLQKFAKRDLSDLQSNIAHVSIRTALPKPKSTEFQSLITTCAKFKDKPDVKVENKQIVKNVMSTRPNEDETYLLANVEDKRPMRFAELTRLKSGLLLSDSNIGQHALETRHTRNSTDMLEKTNKSENTLNISSFVEKFETSEIVISSEDQKRYEISKIKDRICIPRKLWQKGKTYRVEDAYYDDDGEFLYRVPGMTGGD